MHPNVAFGLSLGLLVLGVAVKPSKYRRLFFLPIFALGIFLYRNRLNDADTVPIGLLIVIASDYILLTDVQREIKRTSEPPTSGSLARAGSNGKPDNGKLEGQIEQKGFGERLAWTLYLLYSIRGIGWSHGRWVASCPSVREGCTSRREFFQTRLRWLLLNIILFLIAMAGIEKNPCFHRNAPRFSEQSPLWKAWSMFLFVGASTPLLSIGLNLLPGMLTVSLGISEPEDWPFLFGRAGCAYTIRNFWGRTWHQLLRRPLTSHGKFVARIAGVEGGTEYAHCVQVLFSFLISGLIHTSSLSDLGPLRFFMLQGSGIIVETIALGYFRGSPTIASKLSRENWERIGYVWVWAWFAHTLEPFWSAMAESEVFGRGFNVLDLIWTNLTSGHWSV